METKTIEAKTKQPRQVKLTDDQIVEELEKLTEERELISYQIKKLRNRLNARKFKAKKKALGEVTESTESLLSDVTS